MNIVTILGSPRKSGVTSSIAQSFIDQAAALGATNRIYNLNTMAYKGCQGCFACKSTREDCTLTDDLTPLLEDLKTTDIAVFATPVYYWDVSGQFKTFFDRTWSLVKPDYKTNPSPVRIKKGKKAIFICSQEADETMHTDVHEKYVGFLTMYGFETQLIRSVESSAEDKEKMASMAALAKEAASRLLS